jgi:hypothetical protein
METLNATAKPFRGISMNGLGDEAYTPFAY